jgi:hypothetical protein
MSSQRFAGLAVLCGALALSGWAAGFVGPGSRSIENDSTRIAVDTPQATAAAKDSVDGVFVQGIIDAAFSALPFEVPEIESLLAALPDPQEMLTSVAIASAGTPDPVQNNIEAIALPFEVPEMESILAALPDPQEMLAPVAVASAGTPDPAQTDVEASALSFEVPEMESLLAALPDPQQMLAQATPPVRLVSLFRPATSEDDDLKPAMRVVETPNECLVVEICIDDYLWAFYERTPKVDTNKVKARVKATVTKKGKTRTVTKTVTRYVAADFTWKDPIAAQKVGMSLKDYVIGGMDRRFKLKLYYALRAMDDAGHMPGITSAFRDDYRQAIASGNKAASDSSFHGGSRRGGYGYGLAIDLVSVKGETRMQRWVSTVELWKWLDAREQELGVGRPYLHRDPPHVGPIDGKEFAAKRGGARMKLAASVTSRRQPVARNADPGVMKPEAKAAPVRVGSL